MQHDTEILTDEECRAMLHDKSVGRFVYSDASGPAAIPVNYGVANGEIVIRVARSSHLREVLDGQTAFQVDDLHPQNGHGWSVLVRGSTREVPLEDVGALIRELDHLPQPVAEGIHNVWLLLSPREITGRRLGAEHPPPV